MCTNVIPLGAQKTILALVIFILIYMFYNYIYSTLNTVAILVLTLPLRDHSDI
jgi:hypothetical protein